MALPRDLAFGVFEDLMVEGLRPVLTGFRSGGVAHSDMWPKGSEGFFVYAHFESTQQLGALIDQFEGMRAVADRHGLVAWFSGVETEYDESRYDGTHHGYRVSFETSGNSYTGRSNA